MCARVFMHRTESLPGFAFVHAVLYAHVCVCVHECIRPRGLAQHVCPCLCGLPGYCLWGAGVRGESEVASWALQEAQS